MSIEYQYMSNICQTQTKGKQNNETNKRNKRKQEKGPRGVSRSEGSKTSKASKTLRWLCEGFPLTAPFGDKSLLRV